MKGLAPHIIHSAAQQMCPYVSITGVRAAAPCRTRNTCRNTSANTIFAAFAYLLDAKSSPPHALIASVHWIRLEVGRRSICRQLDGASAGSPDARCPNLSDNE